MRLDDYEGGIDREALIAQYAPAVADMVLMARAEGKTTAEIDQAVADTMITARGGLRRFFSDDFAREIVAAIEARAREIVSERSGRLAQGGNA